LGLSLIPLGWLALAVPLAAQTPAPPATPAQMMAMQQQAMMPLKGFAGVWRGEGWVLVGDRHMPETVTQRVGPMLDGTVQAIETLSYHADGAISFHAFNTVSYDVRRNAFVMQAHAGGLFGSFPFRTTPAGYVWELGDGSHGLRYTATLKDGVWQQVTEQIAPGQPPRTIGTFTLHRLAATDWPAAGAIQP
jgi:hypothetical protein